MKCKHCSNDSLDVLNEIKDCCMQSVSILTELLTLENIESGMLTLDRTLVNAWDILIRSVDTVKDQAQYSGIQITMPTPLSRTAQSLQHTTLNVDQMKIIHALQYLLISACNLSKKGGRITVSANLTEGVISTSKKYSTVVEPILLICISSRIHETSPKMTDSLFTNNNGNSYNNNNIISNEIEVGCSKMTTDLTLLATQTIIHLHLGCLSIVSDHQTKDHTYRIELPIRKIKTEQQRIQNSCKTVVPMNLRMASFKERLESSTKTAIGINNNSIKMNSNNNTTNNSIKMNTNTNNSIKMKSPPIPVDHPSKKRLSFFQMPAYFTVVEEFKKQQSHESSYNDDNGGKNNKPDEDTVGR
eukprot:gene11270-23578_t